MISKYFLKLQNELRQKGVNFSYKFIRRLGRGALAVFELPEHFFDRSDHFSDVPDQFLVYPSAFLAYPITFLVYPSSLPSQKNKSREAKSSRPFQIIMPRN